MRISRIMWLSASLAAFTALAEVAYVNDLLPYDNTIEDGYWNTTDHALKQVQVENTPYASDFDTKEYDAVVVTMSSFDSRQTCGMSVFYR